MYRQRVTCLFVLCSVCIFIPVCALQSIFGQFSNKHLLLLPFRFPLFSIFVCLFSSFLYILSLALIVVDPSLLEYMSDHRDMGEMLTAKKY